MDDLNDNHPPTNPGPLGIPAKRFMHPWRAAAIVACCVIVAVLVGTLILRPADVNARSPVITPDPAGIRVSFSGGRWTNAAVVVNDVFTCNIGDLAPGEHVISWNRFQGPASTALNPTTITKISLRGEVNGTQRVIDCTTTTGPGGSVTSYVTRD